MIENLIYVVLIVILIYVSWDLRKKIWKEYYKKSLKLYPASIFFFMALIFPADYFKKDKIYEGWFTHLLSLVLIGVAIYLFVKLGELI